MKPPLSLYRVTIRTRAHRFAYSALYASSCEAVCQALADWPDVRSIVAHCIARPYPRRRAGGAA